MSFKVHVEPSGHEFSVETGETILDAAIRQGVNLPYGCRNGFCGDCLATLAAGQVDYPNGKPPVMADDSNGECYICQAAPASDLTIAVREIVQSKDLP
ncbi:MAG: 2Fe-2S iron-sulfur cluster-binding protein, partial [Candidatus Thiodiazotropha endolucinida]